MAIAFDTLEYVNKLKAADVPEKQAEAQAQALRAALAAQDVVTKADLRDLEHRMETRFATVDGELKLHRVLLGAILGGVVALVLKAFF